MTVMDSLEIITAFDLGIDEQMKVYEVPSTLCLTSYRYPRPRYQVSVYRTISPLVFHVSIYMYKERPRLKSNLF